MQDVQDAVVLHDHVMAVGEGHSWNAVSCQQHRTRESTLGGEPTEKEFGRALDTQPSGSRTDTDSCLSVVQIMDWKAAGPHQTDWRVTVLPFNTAYLPLIGVILRPTKERCHSFYR